MTCKPFIKIILFSVLFILPDFYGCQKDDQDQNSGTVTDIDGNVYNTVTINTQVWMKENLKTTKYNDGSPIPLVTDNSEWIRLYLQTDKDGYCWYNNDQGSYGNTYGALYNWYVVQPDNICPTGWHLPTDAEWTALVYYLGGESEAGGKIKETGTTHWEDPNEGATNESGFTARPGGGRPHVGGDFIDLGTYGSWWSQPELGETDPTSLSISFNNKSVSRGTTFSTYGHSVRCIKN